MNGNNLTRVDFGLWFTRTIMNKILSFCDVNFVAPRKKTESFTERQCRATARDRLEVCVCVCVLCAQRCVVRMCDTVLSIWSNWWSKHLLLCSVLSCEELGKFGTYRSHGVRRRLETQSVVFVRREHRSEPLEPVLHCHTHTHIHDLYYLESVTMWFFVME